MVDAGIQLEEEGTGEDCLSLRVVWNKTLIDDMLISFGIDSNATSTRLTDQQAGWINYSLTLSDVTQEKKWKVRLGTGGPIVSFPWRLARQWCERGPGFSLSLSAEVPLLNRSRLHLVSHTLVNISDCTGRLLIGCLELCDRTVRISKKNCHFEPLGT